jgi:hypothetical protein
MNVMLSLKKSKNTFQRCEQQQCSSELLLETVFSVYCTRSISMGLAALCAHSNAPYPGAHSAQSGWSEVIFLTNEGEPPTVRAANGCGCVVRAVPHPGGGFGGQALTVHVERAGDLACGPAHGHASALGLRKMRGQKINK